MFCPGVLTRLELRGKPAQQAITQRKTDSSYFHISERALFVFKTERDGNFANASNLLTLYFHVG